LVSFVDDNREMMMTRLTALGAAALMIAAMPSAQAEENSTDQYVLDLGLGVMAKPRYPGSDEVIAVPFPIISVGRFFIPGLGQVIDGDERIKRFSIYPFLQFQRPARIIRFERARRPGRRGLGAGSGPRHGLPP
jgi:MipA family protein